MLQKRDKPGAKLRPEAKLCSSRAQEMPQKNINERILWHLGRKSAKINGGGMISPGLRSDVQVGFVLLVTAHARPALENHPCGVLPDLDGDTRHEAPLFDVGLRSLRRAVRFASDCMTFQASSCGRPKQENVIGHVTSCASSSSVYGSIRLHFKTRMVSVQPLPLPAAAGLVIRIAIWENN